MKFPVDELKWVNFLFMGMLVFFVFVFLFFYILYFYFLKSVDIQQKGVIPSFYRREN